MESVLKVKQNERSRRDFVFGRDTRSSAEDGGSLGQRTDRARLGKCNAAVYLAMSRI